MFRSHGHKRKLAIQRDVNCGLPKGRELDSLDSRSVHNDVITGHILKHLKLVEAIPQGRQWNLSVSVEEIRSNFAEADGDHTVLVTPKTYTVDSSAPSHRHL